MALIALDSGQRGGGLANLFRQHCRRQGDLLIIRIFKPKQKTEEGRFSNWIRIRRAPKDIEATCTVATFDKYVEVVDYIHQRTGFVKPDNFPVFVKADGLPLKDASVKSAMKRVLEAAKLPKFFTAHSFRGASLSQVGENGMASKAAEEHVQVSAGTAAKYYRRELCIVRQDPSRDLPPTPVYSDFIRRRFYLELDYPDDGAVLDDKVDGVDEDTEEEDCFRESAGEN